MISALSIISIIISFIALSLSYTTYRRSVMIEKPEVFLTPDAVNADKHRVVLNDFSRNKNLNIKYIKIKRVIYFRAKNLRLWINKLKLMFSRYERIKPEVDYNYNCIPAQITIKYIAGSILDSYKLKIINNYKTIKIKHIGIFEYK